MQVVEVADHIVLQLLQQVELVVEEDPLQEHLDLVTLVEEDPVLIQVQVMVATVVLVLFSLHIPPNK